jgi:hypothetical protein
VNAPILAVIDALDAAGCRPRETSTGHSFRCPVPGHRRDDRKPSGRAGIGHDGTVLLWCGRGHSAEEIVAEIGLEMGALFPDGDTATHMRRQTFRIYEGGLSTYVPKRGRPELGDRFVAVYDYLDADENIIFRVGRTADKQFPTAHVDPEHGWTWGHPPEASRVLFALPAVLDAVARGSRVFVVEGEKDATNLNAAFPDRIDYVATTKAGGARSLWLPQYTAALTGADVTIIADKDSDGKWAAAQAAKNLMGRARSLVIVEAREGKDTTDHLAAGSGLSDFVIVAADGPVAVMA